MPWCPVLEERWPKGQWNSRLRQLPPLAEPLEAESDIPVLSPDESEQTECHPVRETWLTMCTSCSTQEAKCKAELALLDLAASSGQPPGSVTEGKSIRPVFLKVGFLSLNCQEIFFFCKTGFYGVSQVCATMLSQDLFVLVFCLLACLLVLKQNPAV